jgi:hypothetical protein
MGICGGTAERRATLAGRVRRRWQTCVRRGFALPVVVAIGLASALAGCTSNDSGELLIDPGRYAVYKCDDFAARWKIVSEREKELRGLMERAGQSSGGAVVGSLTYRVEYDAVISDERMLQRTAAEKNCGLPFQAQSGQIQSGQSTSSPPQGGQPQSTQFQSDQSIR